MYFPSRKEFIKKAKTANLIPVYKEIFADFLTPLSAFKRIQHKYSFLFESVEGEEKIARYSFLGSEPCAIFYIKTNKLFIKRDGKNKRIICDDPFLYLKKFMSQYKVAESNGLPRFYGGLVGYIGYDCVRFFENIPDTCSDDLKLLDAVLMLAKVVIVFDHLTRKVKIISNAYIPQNSKSSLSKEYDKTIQKIEHIIKRLNRPVRETAEHFEYGKHSVKIKSNLKKKEFVRIIKRIKGYINKGDIIQAVPSQRFETKIRQNPLDVYRALRSINPSPYMFYLCMDNMKLVGSSPEIMVRVENNIVRLRPIAGTRKRGKTRLEDLALAKELLSDKKECAEHLMLVDLARNDLGRISKPATVKVGEFMIIEKYSHVMHIVSDCTGTLKNGKDAFDVLRACFPAGTVSGAPKIRAMQIIDEVEKTKRKIYAGCVGYFSFSGNMDTCITIRTILIKGSTAYIQAGCGIVADSMPEKEYKETQNKAAAMIKAIEAATRA